MLLQRFLGSMGTVLLGCMLSALVNGAPASRPEQEISQLQAELVHAYIHRDTAALDRILADDYAFVTDRGEVLTKSAVLASFGAGGDRTIASYRIVEATVKIYGDSAVMVYRYISREEYEGRDDSGNYRVTRVFARLNDRWRIVAGQETRIAP